MKPNARDIIRWSGQNMSPCAAIIRWVGTKQPERPWLAQIAWGRVTETLGSDHETEELALAAARAEIRRRLRSAVRWP